MRAIAMPLILVAAAALFAANNESEKTYKGEIADGSCAMNIHSLTRSHQEMLKNKSMGGTNSSCTRYCVENLGSFYVLANKHSVYRLEGQLDRVWQALAGKQVTLHGVLDTKTSTLQVTSLEHSQ